MSPFAQMRLVPNHRPEQTFTAAWTIYPRKEARKDGLKAWCDLNPDEALVAEILTAMTWQAHLWVVVEGRDRRYIPLFGTYIRAERWTDEKPEPAQPKPAPVVLTRHSQMGMQPRPAPSAEWLARIRQAREEEGL